MGYTEKDKIDDKIKLVQKRKKIKKGGIFFERELYQSKAFLALNKNAMKFVIALLDARKREPQHQAKDKKGRKQKPKFINLHCLELTYGVLEKVYGIPRSSIPRAISDAMEKGFCTINYRGGSCRHDKTQYAWSDNYVLWGPDTKPFATRLKEVEHRGYQGKMLGATNVKVAPVTA